MSPDAPTPDRPSEPRPRGAGDSGERGRSRRRSGRGGRGRGGSGAAGSSGSAPEKPADGQAPSRGDRPERGERRERPERRERGGNTAGATPVAPGNGGGNGQGRGERPGGGENRRRSDRGGRGNSEGGRPGGNGERRAEAGRPAERPNDSARPRRQAERESEPTPNLADWSFDCLGYTAWMAHAQILPNQSPDRTVRSYIVDVHAGEDAVNPRLWPEIAPFLDLEVTAPTPETGVRRLIEAFRTLAAEAPLRPAADYLQENPPVEASIASPVQAALDTAIALEPDTEQEDIDAMNEGRVGVRLPLPA